MNAFENKKREVSPSAQLSSLLAKKIQTRDFHLEEGETSEDVVARCRLIEKVINRLDQIAPQIISEYRQVLENNGVNFERTGKLSLVVVGGRVHGESQLKTWSDIDVVITAEKPFLSTRRVFLTPEEEKELPEPLVRSGGMKKEMMTIFLSTVLTRLSEMVGTDLSEEGILELKGYGDQRNEDIKEGLVIFAEK